MTVSEKVFSRLDQLSMSQKEFSEKTGILPSTISEWKKKKTNPLSEKIMPICDALGVTPEWLLSEEDSDGSSEAENLKRKPINSLFLEYLLKSENDIDERIEKWEQDVIGELDEMSEVIGNHKVFIMACWGEMGWCLPECKKKGAKLGKVLADFRNNVPLYKIDAELAECFREREIESLTILIQRKVSDSDSKKLDVAFELYLKQEYFTSAVLLAGLIDSTSINQFLKTNVCPDNVGQCWKCYGKVIQENFGETYFSGTFPSEVPVKNNKRAKATIEFFESIKTDDCFDNKKKILIPLSFALLKFYDDSNWSDKQKAIIPSSINRHWLVHNMYDYDDITRADCIKLFCMLYQMVELYSLL